MLREVERERWPTFLDKFSERNRLRDAQLQISGQIGSPRVERGLLLESVTLKLEGDGARAKARGVPAQLISGGRDPHLVAADLIVAHARQTGARVTFVEDAALLSDVGGVGALLRYRL